MGLLRAVGSNEHRCISRDVLGLYGYIVATATYEGPLLTKPVLYEALKLCIAQHPVLSTVIQEAESQKPQLAMASNIDLEKHVRWSEPSGGNGSSVRLLRERLLDIHNEPRAEYETIPQWRVWVFLGQQDASSSKTTFDIAFSCSHALADGMSLYAFHRSFLLALLNLRDVESPTSAIYEVRAGKKLLPSLDQVANMTVSWKFLLRAWLTESIPGFVANAFGLNGCSAGAWHGAAARPTKSDSSELLPTALEMLCIPHAALQRVLKVGRENKARLTSLLNHLTSRALADALKKRGQTSSRFEVEISINLRKCIPEGRNEIANYASAIEQVHDVSANPDLATPLTSSDWETIRQRTKDLEESSSTLSDQPIALLTYLSDFRQWVLQKASTPAGTAFGMSNLGVFVDNKGPEQEWTLKQMVFSQSADATSAAFNLNVACVTDGPLAISLTWWPGMLGVDDEEHFTRDVLEAINSQLEAMV